MFLKVLRMNKTIALDLCDLNPCHFDNRVLNILFRIIDNYENEKSIPIQRVQEVDKQGLSKDKNWKRMEFLPVVQRFPKYISFSAIRYQT